jgi:hypothetical protein
MPMPGRIQPVETIRNFRGDHGVCRRIAGVAITLNSPQASAQRRSRVTPLRGIGARELRQKIDAGTFEKFAI